MHYYYSELINKFKDTLGTPKEMIEETFNKPDATDVVVNEYISIRSFGDYYIIVIFEMGDTSAKFINAYRIYPKMLDGMDIGRSKPFDVLKEFMNKYGIAKDIPGYGQQKIFVKREMRVVFLGLLDVEKYLADVKNF